FSRLRAGDRFWYENTFSGSELKQLQNTRLADVIERNTNLTSIQPNPFFFRPEVSGTVTAAAGRRGAAGLQVQLVGADGEVAATVTTDARGRYHFGVADGLRTGAYTIRVLTADGTTVNGPTVAVTSGDSKVTANVSLAQTVPGAPHTGESAPTRARHTSPARSVSHASVSRI